jgi:hypothetical protein
LLRSARAGTGRGDSSRALRYIGTIIGSGTEVGAGG